MERSFGVFFHLKKTKKLNSAMLPVYLRITINGRVTELSTKREHDPLRWNTRAGRAEGKTDEARSLNAYLDVLQRKVYEIRRQLIEDDKQVTAGNIKTIMQGGEIREHRHMLMEIFREHNDQMAALVGMEYAAGTLERYETSFRHTRSFLQWKYGKDDIDIVQLDHEFITGYEFWLKSTRKCDHNSTIKYLSNLGRSSTGASEMDGCCGTPSSVSG